MKYEFSELIDRVNLGSAKWMDMKNLKSDVSEGIVPLSVADMEFKNPPEIINGLKAYMDKAVLGYTLPRKEYYDAVISWMKRRNDWEINADSIVCTSGVIPALSVCVRAYSRPGEGVIVLTPVYYPFYRAVTENGREVVKSSLINQDGYYEMDFEDIEKKAKNTKNTMLFLCSPHNPVGRVWRKEELQRLGKICRENKVVVISDEIHSDLIMSGFKHTVFNKASEGLKEISVICTSPSKTFNLAGMQTANMIIENEDLREKYKNEFSMTFGVPFLNILGYESCRIAYNECEEWLEELLQVIDQNRRIVEDYVKKYLPEVKIIPMEGTYLQWLDFSGFGIPYKELEQKNINEAEVFFDEGYVFGEEGIGFERINLAAPAYVIENAMKRIVTTYKK